MKALFLGNQGNRGYRIVRWLRERDIDAVLCFDPSKCSSRSLPEWEDSHLKGCYPDWIKTVAFFPFLHLFEPGWRVRKLSKGFDVVLTAGNAVIPALNLGKPVVFFPVGSDITELPYLSETFIHGYLSYVYRRRIKKISRIIVGQEDSVQSAQILGVGSKVTRLAFPVDVEKLNRTIHSSIAKKIHDQYGRYERVFFCPSRKVMNPDSLSYKAPEKLIQAFHLLLEKYPDADIKIIMGMHGEDSDAFKDLISSSGIIDKCDFTDHLNLSELHAYMSLPNIVVFDQFAVRNYSILGGVEREAISIGAKVVSATRTDTPEFIETVGPDCPMYVAFSPEEIFMVCDDILNESKDISLLKRKQSTEWAYKHLHWENSIDTIVKTIENASSVVLGE